MSSRFFLACILFLALAMTGCSDGMAAVDGTISLDGQPVKSGSIKFVSTDPPFSGGGVIANGQFRTRLPPGNYTIELSGSRVSGKRTQKGFDGKDEIVEEQEEVFPPHLQTGLKQEVKAGSNTVTLDLKSKK